MEVSLSRRSSLASRAMRFAFILLACLFMGFAAYSSTAHAEGETQVQTQQVVTTTAAQEDEGESFFIYFMMFVVLLVIIVVVIVASSTSASVAAYPTVFERWEE